MILLAGSNRGGRRTFGFDQGQHDPEVQRSKGSNVAITAFNSRELTPRGCIARSKLRKSLRRTLRKIPARIQSKVRRTGLTASGGATEASERISQSLEETEPLGLRVSHIVCPSE